MNGVYYDKILGGITACLVTGILLGTTTGIPLNIAIGGGAAMSAPLMYHAMFRNAPVRTPAQRPL